MQLEKLVFLFLACFCAGEAKALIDEHQSALLLQSAGFQQFVDGYSEESIVFAQDIIELRPEKYSDEYHCMLKLFREMDAKKYLWYELVNTVKDMSPDDLMFLLDWYSSKSGQKMLKVMRAVSLENELHYPEGGLSKEEEVFWSFLDIESEAESLMLLDGMVFSAIYSSLLIIEQDVGRVNYEEVFSTYKLRFMKFKQEVQADLLGRYIKGFSVLGVEVTQEYADLLKTPEHKRFYDYVTRAYNNNYRKIFKKIPVILLENKLTHRWNHCSVSQSKGSE